MEITFSLVRAKEIVNIYDGKKLGRATDIVFSRESGQVLGITLPGQGKLFHKKDDLFVAMNKIIKIGEDVILVNILPSDTITFSLNQKKVNQNNFIQSMNNQALMRELGLSSNISQTAVPPPNTTGVNNVTGKQTDQESFVRFKKTKINLK